MDGPQEQITACVSEVKDAIGGRWMSLATLYDWIERRYSEDVFLSACQQLVESGCALIEKDHKGHVVLVSSGLRIGVTERDEAASAPDPRPQVGRMRRSATIKEIVGFLQEHPGVTVSAISEALNMENSGVSAALVRLKRQCKIRFERFDGETCRRYFLADGVELRRRAGRLPDFFTRRTGARHAHAN